MISVGFTGTRRGMHPRQQARVFSILHNLRSYIEEFRHGDCIGADEQSHELAKILGFKVIIHPPTETTFRAFCQGAWEVVDPKDYLARDRDIVRASTLVIAAPRTKEEEKRSGTWYTARYAQKRRRGLLIVHHDGEVVPMKRGQLTYLNEFWDALEEEIDA